MTYRVETDQIGVTYIESGLSLSAARYRFAMERQDPFALRGRIRDAAGHVVASWGR